MRISENGLNLIKKFEGCKLNAYKAVSTEKYYTIGWGHYGADVKKGQIITQTQADAMLKNDITEYENAVNVNCSYLNLNQNQFDALVSFTYNCGVGNLKSLIAYGSRNANQIAESILAYNKSSSKVLTGLTKRRQAEKDLFLTPVLVSQNQILDIFNSELYYSLYPDLQEAFGQDETKLREHFENCGVLEGRRFSYVFDVHYYFAKYEDLRNNIGPDCKKLYEHFITCGIKEGRQGCDEFDIVFYKNNNEDLKNMSNEQALQHFLSFGINEGRATSAYFNIQNYKTNYEDLRKVFGDNYKEYFKHYLLFR